jgi:hypothetical protein
MQILCNFENDIHRRPLRLVFWKESHLAWRTIIYVCDSVYVNFSLFPLPTLQYKSFNIHLAFMKISKNIITVDTASNYILNLYHKQPLFTHCARKQHFCMIFMQQLNLKLPPAYFTSLRASQLTQCNNRRSLIWRRSSVLDLVRLYSWISSVLHLTLSPHMLINSTDQSLSSGATVSCSASQETFSLLWTLVVEYGIHN